MMITKEEKKPVHVFKLKRADRYYVIFPLTGNLYVKEGKSEQLVGKVKGVPTFIKDVRELGTYSERKELARLPDEVQAYIAKLRKKNK